MAETPNKPGFYNWLLYGQCENTPEFIGIFNSEAEALAWKERVDRLYPAYTLKVVAVEHL